MNSFIATYIHVTGLVQGVGFRPFIYRIATQNGIKGWVENGNDGVRIHAEGPENDLYKFIGLIRSKAPSASSILDIKTSQVEFGDYQEFSIVSSRDYSDDITEISPDIAVCEQCLEDMKVQPHRLDYPFINCTNCGPRFTIIEGVPYDRAKTTMSPFPMCNDCKQEYSNVTDRRFHAQPVACNRCGPQYMLIAGTRTIKGTADIVAETVRLIDSGKVVAIKGMGGFHLACDARNEEAVSALRQRKYREGKPFAVMFRDIAAVKEFTDMCPDEEETLKSWKRPIVILKNRTENHRLAYSVSNGFDTTGIMLPYMPIHYLLFEKLAADAVVLTSGNISDEPVLIDNDAAIGKLSRVADAFLVYNRDIFNRADDSVVQVSGGVSRLLRRSRGYAPSPVNLAVDVDGIFAAGAELVNCFCLGKGNKAFMSQHIGDLKNLETLDFYSESFKRYKEMFRVQPQLVVCDLHPDYLSTRFAQDFAERSGNLPVVRVQHHHAHIAACMAEHNLDEKVIGISMDGVGYGTDGNIWGFEIMTCTLDDFERKTHLDYIPQPGGDKANHEPWRMAVAYLHRYVGKDISKIHLPFLKNIPFSDIEIIIKAIEHRINSPLTSSAGRLFDAVAAIVGLCTHTSFHAEAPMRLENILDDKTTGMYHFNVTETIDPGPVIRQIVKEASSGVAVGEISARFHRAVAEVLELTAGQIREQSGINKVVLSGGTFQNRYLIAETEKILIKGGFRVYTHYKFPSNDGGLALGQLVIAAKKRSLHHLEQIT